MTCHNKLCCIKAPFCGTQLREACRRDVTPLKTRPEIHKCSRLPCKQYCICCALPLFWLCSVTLFCRQYCTWPSTQLACLLYSRCVEPRYMLRHVPCIDEVLGKLQEECMHADFVNSGSALYTVLHTALCKMLCRPSKLQAILSRAVWIFGNDRKNGNSCKTGCYSYLVKKGLSIVPSVYVITCKSITRPQNASFCNTALIVMVLLLIWKQSSNLH